MRTMADLIDRGALGVGRCNPDVMLDPAYAAGWNGLLNIINNAPTIDPVHAAGACYCRECGYCVHQPGIKDAEWICVERHTYCDCGAKIVFPNHFCSYGEPKEVEL